MSTTPRFVLRELLDVIGPHVEGLARGRQVLRLRAGVNVVIETRSGRDRAGDSLVTTPDFHLRRDDAATGCDLYLWLDCDQYIY